MLRRTKILTTLGPATDNPKVLADMIRAGADVVRVNFSHGEPQAHAKRVEMVRSVGEQVGKWVAILGDLQGPKIRIERFVDGKIVLNEGEPFALDVSLDARAGTQSAVGVAYKNLPNDVRTGDRLLLNDGQLVLDITAVNGPRIDTRVVIGGELSDNKGINKQGGGLSAGALTDKGSRRHQARGPARCRLSRRLVRARRLGHGRGARVVAS
jgi:pyruvate kinase